MDLRFGAGTSASTTTAVVVSHPYLHDSTREKTLRVLAVQFAVALLGAKRLIVSSGNAEKLPRRASSSDLSPRNPNSGREETLATFFIPSCFSSVLRISIDFLGEELNHCQTHKGVFLPSQNSHFKRLTDVLNRQNSWVRFGTMYC